ncbi:MAG: DAK2 domain-containing protein [Thermoleophilia bacterium]
MEPSVAPVTVAGARLVVAGGHRALEARKQVVNDLNVYPVPDGDTGTNLLLTVRSIVDDVSRAPEGLSRSELCDLIANAALMGARGNSGVILSQIVRGAMEALALLGDDRPLDVATVLRKATDTAYRAVRKPVEGTMLTVLREITEAAEGQPPGADIMGVLRAVVQAGWASVENTPTLLKVLADAGVVDAGGYGLVVLAEGMIGADGYSPSAEAVALGSVQATDHPEHDPDTLYSYCTSFLLQGTHLDGPELETLLTPLGDSLLVVGSDTRVKVHVHTDEPGTVLALGLARGTLHQIEIENMKEQTAARDARLRAQAGAPTVVGETQVIAVVAGAGVRKLFASLGAGPLVEGGQSMNPSAEEIMKAVALTEAPGVIVLPNNKNIIMTAEQVAALAARPVGIVPARSMQAGLSAMVAFDPDRSLERNVEEMTQALSLVLTGEVTRAVRDSSIDGVEVTEGSFIGLVEGRVVASAAELQEVVDAVAGELLDGTRELMTILVGDGESTRAARQAAERLRDRYQDVEFEIHDGGQPLYPLLLAAE